jgi:hypothetical protein
VNAPTATEQARDGKAHAQHNREEKNRTTTNAKRAGFTILPEVTHNLPPTAEQLTEVSH